MGVHDNFFALGGASTQSLQVAALAQAEGIPLTPGSIFQCETIAELAAVYAGDHEPYPEIRAANDFKLDRRNTVIESLGVYLPPRAVSTSEVLQGCKASIPMPLERLTGIKSRRMAEGEFSIDLAAKAIAACLAKSKYNPEDIDLLICCNISRCDGPDGRFSFEPSTSMRLRKLLRFDNAMVFDIANACAGMFTAIYIVDAYLKAGRIRCGMVASGEYITHLTGTAQKEIEGFLDHRLACLTLGDAGAALILEQASDSAVGFHDVDIYTASRHASLCIAKATDRPHGGAIMLTDSIRQTAIAVNDAVNHAVHVMQRGGWQPEEIQHLIMHQTSETSLNDGVTAINKLFKKQAAHTRNTIYNLAHRGNTATTSHFVALHDHILTGRIRPGDNVLFSITGSGQTIGAARYTLDTLPDRIRAKETTGRGAVPTPPRTSHTHARHHSKARIRIESVGTVSEGRQIERRAVEFAKAAALACMERSTYDLQDLDILIYAGVYREEFISEPALAALVAGQLGINDCPESSEKSRTLAFDIANGGLGFLNACHVATQLISAKKCRTAMVCASEFENNLDNFPDRLRGIRETGSAALLCESEDGTTGFGQFSFRYFPEFLDALTSFTRQDMGRNYVHVTKDENLDNLYLTCISEAVHDLLRLENLDTSQIKVVFPPQLSKPFLARLRAQFGLASGGIVDIAQDGMDLFTSSLASTLLFAREKKLVEAGDIGLIIDVGAGIQVGCATYRF